MPQFIYRARDKNGQLKVGQRAAETMDALNADLIREGIYPIQIAVTQDTPSLIDQILDLFQSKQTQLQELSIFSRQMQQLHNAGVPIVSALKQLASFTRSKRLAQSINGVIEHVEKGQSLATSMSNYPKIFTPLMVALVRIGEDTGHLGDSFSHLHHYLEFELNSRKQLKASFRYPLFIIITIIFTIIILNVFVIPSFARFYSGSTATLPWQTKFLVSMSYITINYGFYILAAFGAGLYLFYRYLQTTEGRYKWDKFKLNIPIYKNVMRHILMIRFSQSMAIILNSGIQVNKGLKLIKNILNNTYINKQISEMEEAIERGNSFTQALTEMDFFTPLELQIISVGEKNGQIGPSLNYISSFHTQEIEYDLKKMNDTIGPILIAIISGLILIIALGVYLPIWNMVNLGNG